MARRPRRHRTRRASPCQTTCEWQRHLPRTAAVTNSDARPISWLNTLHPLYTVHKCDTSGVSPFPADVFVHYSILAHAIATALDHAIFLW